jgi:muramoyltetrapeptide carboxypeptidase
MTNTNITVVSPCGTFCEQKFAHTLDYASHLGIKILSKSEKRIGLPCFLNGSKNDRLEELFLAENLDADAIWCTRGGVGAIELWHDYKKENYEFKHAPLIGYSDITLLHFMRFYRANRIGIHGPIFLDLCENYHAFFHTLLLLIKKSAQNLTYPALKRINPFLSDRLSGELIVMNLTSLQSIIGCFDPQFFHGKILALEDVNEPHYKVFRSMQQLKNIGSITGLRALLIGQFGSERKSIIEETMMPLADEFGFSLFDWPIFGHEKPNWPLLFGAKVTINKVNHHFFTLAYNEQHDHTPIHHDF